MGNEETVSDWFVCIEMWRWSNVTGVSRKDDKLLNYHRVKWCGQVLRDVPESTILRRHKYGMLSNSAPAWATGINQAQQVDGQGLGNSVVCF